MVGRHLLRKHDAEIIRVSEQFLADPRPLFRNRRHLIPVLAHDRKLSIRAADTRRPIQAEDDLASFVLELKQGATRLPFLHDVSNELSSRRCHSDIMQTAHVRDAANHGVEQASSRCNTNIGFFCESQMSSRNARFGPQQFRMKQSVSSRARNITLFAWSRISYLLFVSNPTTASKISTCCLTIMPEVPASQPNPGFVIAAISQKFDYFDKICCPAQSLRKFPLLLNKTRRILENSHIIW
eukprot:737559_1